MSQEKTIKINPELFSLKSNKSKTLKNKGNEKKPTIKINNLVKNKLIEKVKEFQKNNKKEVLEKKSNSFNNSKTEHIDTPIVQNNEYEDSLSFLKILSEKNEKKKNKKNQRTLKNLHSSNIYVHNDLPDDFKKDTDNLKKDFQQPYGCLKRGTKPTYREWLKKTQKNKIQAELLQINNSNNLTQSNNLAQSNNLT